MTNPKYIINIEQIEAMQDDAANKNPNKDKIVELRVQSKKITDEIMSLMSPQEKWTNLMLALATFDNKDKAVSFMSNQELGDHVYNLFSEYCCNSLDSAILDELLKRVGYKYEQDIDTTKKDLPPETI